MQYIPDAEETQDLEHSSFSMEYRKPEYPVTMMLPYIDGIRGPVVAAALYYAKIFDIGFEILGNTEIDKARNELADRFLKSRAEWSFWVDSDVFIPYGKADPFLAYTQATKGREFASHNTLLRLMGHRQVMVGGVYAGRFKRAPLTIQPDLAPRNPMDSRASEAIREGKSAGGLVPVDWLAAGLMLVHKTVFQAIMKTQPVEPNFPGEYYPFFTRFSDVTGGEDIAFCYRARKAGVQPVLDTEVRAGHIGLSMFMPEDSKPPVRLGGR